MIQLYKRLKGEGGINQSSKTKNKKLEFWRVDRYGTPYRPIPLIDMPLIMSVIVPLRYASRYALE